MRGTQIKTADEVRVFAHDAVAITASATAIAGTESRGVCLYIGADMTSITVTMESGNPVVFKAIPAGTFLPILVTHLTNVAPAGVLAANDILALY
jgi:hypothetical protein